MHLPKYEQAMHEFDGNHVYEDWNEREDKGIVR